ncbi:MAG: response regulator transcription factor [Candidatus Thiodiazotropha sp.]
MDRATTQSDVRIWRLLLVDDHPLVRFGLSRLIDDEPDLEICGETGMISEALELARMMLPDLAIIDLSLADGNGLDLVKRLRAHYEDIRILVCSMHDESLFAQRSITAGARGYINKQEATTHIIDAIRHVLGDKVWLSQQMTERLLQGMVDGETELKVASIDKLSDRELEVFGLIGRGKGPSQIAEYLHLSVKTIETHREKIKKKLNLKSGSELSRWAIQWTMDQE